MPRKRRALSSPQVPMFLMRVRRNSMWIVVDCTRCGNTFMVTSKWAHSAATNTRPCPYCFKVSGIRKES